MLYMTALHQHIGAPEARRGFLQCYFFFFATFFFATFFFATFFTAFLAGAFFFATFFFAAFFAGAFFATFFFAAFFFAAISASPFVSGCYTGMFLFSPGRTAALSRRSPPDVYPSLFRFISDDYLLVEIYNANRSTESNYLKYFSQFFHSEYFRFSEQRCRRHFIRAERHAAHH